MFPILFLSILLTNLKFSTCNYLEAEANYHKPKLERNNIVNKGVWVRNKSKENIFQKSSLGDFIFRTNSLDADRLLQTNFETFADNAMDDTPFVSAYVERERRSPNQIRKRHSRKNVNSKTRRNSIKDIKTNSLVSNLKTNSAFNNYPYDVDSLLNNGNKDLNIIKNINKTSQINETLELILPTVGDYIQNATEISVKARKTNITEAITKTSITSKRSKKHNYGIDNDEPFNFIEDANQSDGNDKSKPNRNIFDKEDRAWHQNAPIPDTTRYEVMPHEPENSKGVNEKGLIRVISMITKSFKKITKQHKDMKVIHESLNTINTNFLKQTRDLNIKFQDFDSKYADMIQFNERLKLFEDKLINEVEYLKTKHKEMNDNIVEFESQQKKFLAQQKQFYSVQKVMLAQNEKINLKQIAISKTQSEISHRQNNFARILKKAKQLIVDRKHENLSKEKDYGVINTITNTAVQTKTTVDSISTTNLPITSESIKFNLFSVPAKNKLQNQDELIIKEKDKRPIDDLVYKYYFNNTFIDNLMKSKILNQYDTNTNSIEIARHAKNKRGEIETTILLPINGNTINKNRVRRWIGHLGEQKYKKLNSYKNTINKSKPDLKKAPKAKSDPFLTMATSFCNEIGQNTNGQTLNWCIEKALRRLKFMDQKLFSKPVTVMKEKKTQVLQQVSQIEHSTPKPVTILPIAPSTVLMTTNLVLEPMSTPLYAVPNQEIFFPDNEELESNLKQFDLTPDTEGTVYYDGSLHFSDMGRKAHDSDGMSDFMPGLVDSNSQFEMNPMAFDIQAKRRALVTRLNEDIMKKYKSRKL